MKHPFTLIYSLLILFFSLQLNAQSKFDNMVNRTLSHTVNEIKTDSLKQIQASVVVLDAREKNEFEVSHLKDAKHCGYDQFNEACLEGIDTSQVIVVYCSIGYRSEKIAEKIKAKGYSKVYNLYGGIFDWTNKGYPVYNTEGQTNDVHAYNKIWGRWVEKSNKVYK